MTEKEIVVALRTTESRNKRELLDAAADLIEKLTDRCARYAEEIAVLQEKTRERTLNFNKNQEEFIMNNNQDYIVRCDRAGVFFGKIKERNGSEVTMTEVRKLWSWAGACAVEQLAQDGTKTPVDCRFTVTIPKMTVLGAIQIIPCTDDASVSLRGVKEWKI